MGQHEANKKNASLNGSTAFAIHNKDIGRVNCRPDDTVGIALQYTTGVYSIRVYEYPGDALPIRL